MDGERSQGRARRARRARFGLVMGALGLIGLFAQPAQAQWAVVDVGAIAKLVQEVGLLEKQLATARSTLSQARSEYSALTGPRAMASLLAGIKRNYLPEDFTQLQAVLSGASTEYAALAAQMRALEGARAVLTPDAIAALSSAERELVVSRRDDAALLAETSRQALAAASDRFASLQALIDAISSARDPKADLDLQARIEAEQTMLENEQVKLRALHQVIAGQVALSAEQRREQAVADVGNLRRLAPLTLPGLE